MSIFIKGMEMPKNEPLLVKINPDGSVSTTARNDYRKYEAIPVPEPHGDLIDRKALMEGEGRYVISLCKEGIDVEEILRAKVIIPASEEKT